MPPAKGTAAAMASAPLPGAPKVPTVTDVYSSVLDSIEELSVAPNAGSDEVRFSDLPPKRRRPASIELDLSDLELGEALEPDTTDEGNPTAVSLSRLPLFPLFADLPAPALARVVQAAELVELQDGEVLVRRGEPADALFGLVEGKARVIAQESSHYLTLSEGEVLGEACLLQDEPRSADIVADGPLTALRVPREALYEVVTEYPRLAEILLELLTRRLLGNLLQTSPLFRSFDVKGKQLLARSVEVRRAAAGTLLCEAGKRVDALYIALTGKLEVQAPGAGTTLYGPGSMFGQDALLTRAAAACDIRAHVNMVVLRLSSERFLPVAMEHPELIDRLSQISDAPVVNISV